VNEDDRMTDRKPGGARRAARSRPPVRPRPTTADLERAAGRTISDVIAPDLDVLFCGINPGLYSGATGHHFARPGNRFWPALFAAGFTPRPLSPWEKSELLSLGCGITNLVDRSTASAADLTAAELLRGRRRLEAKVRRYHPRAVAIVGITAYRVAFQRPLAQLGRQPEPIGESLLWVLPNPSGLNAHHRPADFARAFRELRDAMTTGRYPLGSSGRSRA
jgi:TDG/mug DNA glycosylase family protein